jgi:hypothetical protein
MLNEFPKSDAAKDLGTWSGARGFRPALMDYSFLVGIIALELAPTGYTDPFTEPV